MWDNPLSSHYVNGCNVPTIELENYVTRWYASTVAFWDWTCSVQMYLNLWLLFTQNLCQHAFILYPIVIVVEPNLLHNVIYLSVYSRLFIVPVVPYNCTTFWVSSQQFSGQIEDHNSALWMYFCIKPYFFH